MQSSRSIGLSVQGIGRDAAEIKTIQTVLEVLSIYWKPLRQLVRLSYTFLLVCNAK